MDRDVHIALILTGSIPVIALLARGGAAGTGATLGLLMIGAGVVGLARGAHRNVTRARVVGRSRRRG